MRSIRLLAMAAVAAVLLLCAGSAGAVIYGDTDGNGRIELKDAIRAMWAASELSSDGEIGLAEVLYDLRVLVGFGGGRGRAVLGPLAGATVEVYRLSNLETPIYTATTDAAGYFDTGLLPEDLSKYVLVAVSGGQDTDADDDGVTDGTPTPNAGTIHGLMTAGEFASGGFRVTALSDIVWQYTKNLIGDVDGSGLKLRLDELAKTLFTSDLNGDGAIDADDVLNFVPMLAAHQEKLNFDFSTLFAENADGHSVIGAYHNNLPDVLSALLADRLWQRLTPYAEPGVQYDKVKITVARLGRGKVTSDIGGIDMDSERDSTAEDTASVFFDRSAENRMVLTATPTDETEIMNWRGCDTVSEDKSRCELSLAADRLVTVSFGYKETVLQPGITLADLSDAAVTASADQTTLNVTAGAGDTVMMAKLAALKAGDIVVGSSGGGFLRRLVSVQKVSDGNYVLTTEDATLEEVLAQGSGGFYKQMTHGDLSVETRRRSRSSDAGTDGFYLMPSDDPNDTVFRFVTGDPRTRAGIEGELKWPQDDPRIVLKGSIDVSIDLDKDISYTVFPPGLEYFKLIPKIRAEESLDLSIIAEAETGDELEMPVGQPIKFAPITFFIGPVPVVVTPEIQVYIGIKVKTSGGVTAGVSFKQSVRCGVVYHRGAGAELVEGFESSADYIPPTLSGEMEGSFYVKVKPVVYFWKVTGPAVNIKAYDKLKAESEFQFFSDDPCRGGMKASLYSGLQGGFEWDLGMAKKLGSWAEDVQLEVKFKPYENLLKTWEIASTCGTRPPVIEVSGMSLFASAAVGAGTVLSGTYTVKNTGDLNLEWENRYIEDGVMNVSPRGGTLASGASETVSFTVNTGGLPLGLYRNEIKFINLYDGGVSSVSDGSCSRLVEVQMVASPAAPVLNAPSMATDSQGKVIPSMVNLSWSYADAGTEGFLVYLTTTPNLAGSWQRAAVITDGAVRSWSISNLMTNTTYYFALGAYDAYAETVLSNAVSIKTPDGGGTVGDTFTNSLGMTFVRIPAGTFMMGSPADEPGRFSDETLHQVTLTNDFYMMTTEVTQGQWEAVMGSNPSYFTACGGECPVETVSWEDVQDFITKLNAMDGRIYRLPTEAEWEYAARAGTQTAFYNGGITNTSCTPLDPNLDQIGWYCGNADVDGSSTTHPVGQKQPNAWGLYDMSGNVWEWCQDWYGTYPTDAVTNPTGSATASYRVFRGGGWFNGAQNCRSAYRLYLIPTNRHGYFGFRLALSPSR